MKLLLATLLFATPAFAGSYDFTVKQPVCDRSESFRRTVTLSSYAYSRHVDTFGAPTGPVHGGDDSGMVNIYPPYLRGVDPWGALVLTGFGKEHSWFHATPEMIEHLPHHFDLVLEAQNLTSNLKKAWLDVNVEDWEDADLWAMRIGQVEAIPEGFGTGVAMVSPGLSRHTYDLFSTSGAPLGHLAIEQSPQGYSEHWIIDDGLAYETPLALLKQYGTVQVRRSQQSYGSIVQLYEEEYLDKPPGTARAFTGQVDHVAAGCTALGWQCPIDTIIWGL